MSQARLLSITLERFKSYRDATTIELAPLTILLGRNNSGKSSIIQALLLLKQTLMQPRTDVPLHMEGPYVEALSLSELTYGWPSKENGHRGPSMSLHWRENFQGPNNPNNYPRLANSSLSFGFLADASKSITLGHSELHLVADGVIDYRKEKTLGEGAYYFFPGLEDAKDLTSYGPSYQRRMGDYYARDRFRSILRELLYLSSSRSVAPSLFRSSSTPPEDLGVNGEYAAQLLQTRRSSQVHYLRPVWLDGGPLTMPTQVERRGLVEAANDVMRALGVDVPLSVEDVGDFGFRLLFGQASLQHVGRGLNYLLPVILQGLLADPLRFGDKPAPTQLGQYLAEFPLFPICALEEPEIHLHPKVQSRLAHWFLAMAMAGRQLIVETHSDHLVRRLRALVARAEPGSPAEKWLLENVRILNVTQDSEGCSHIETMHLTPQGGIEQWPDDFMDVATQEEQTIYLASLDKPAPEATPPPAPEPVSSEVEHDVGDEPDVAQ